MAVHVLFFCAALQAHAPEFTAVYLESALDLGLATPREVHSELLLIYLHMALEEEREGVKRWVRILLCVMAGSILWVSDMVLKSKDPASELIQMWVWPGLLIVGCLAG